MAGMPARQGRTEMIARNHLILAGSLILNTILFCLLLFSVLGSTEPDRTHSSLVSAKVDARPVSSSPDSEAVFKARSSPTPLLIDHDVTHLIVQLRKAGYSDELLLRFAETN